MSESKEKILAVCSTIDFPNFTRRATVEAIADQIPGTELLLFNGFKAQFGGVKGSDIITTHQYHNWLPGTLSESGFLGSVEKRLRRFNWKEYFKKYDIIFLSDPNQHLLLDYIEKETPVIYLIRDPNILQDTRNRDREERILKRADLVLATSQHLAEEYLPKYYGWDHPDVVFWPNCVDLDIWDPNQFHKKDREPVIGVAGNFSQQRTDYDLLETIADEMKDVTFEIAGKIDRNAQPHFWARLLQRNNVRYLGLIPHQQLPETVSRWKVGLVTDRVCEYTSYMHHNKVYQYLSMGVPVVSLKIHDDYNELQPYVSVSNNRTEYIENIKMQTRRSEELTYRKECIKLASKNSASDRVKKFLQLVKQVNHQKPEADSVNV